LLLLTIQLNQYDYYIANKTYGQVERTHCIPLRSQYPVVVYALERLQNQGDDKAGQFLASIMRFQFIIALVI
jgi:hypothetical protein